MKEWWQDFFSPIAGEIMFETRASLAAPEVKEVLRQTCILPQAKVLDLACGTGRHSLEFAKLGFDVTGLDYSSNYIVSAKQAAKKAKLKIEFVKGDMKTLRQHFSKDQFQLVVSLYNSFGYFKSKSDDLKMLREVYRVLAPDGKFVLNTLNGGGVALAMAKPISAGREPLKNVFMIDSAAFDPVKKHTYSEWTIIDARKTKAKVHRMKFQQNVYTHAELKAMLKSVGFKIETTWGMLQGGKFDPKSTWHQTIVAKK